MNNIKAKAVEIGTIIACSWGKPSQGTLPVSFVFDKIKHNLEIDLETINEPLADIRGDSFQKIKLELSCKEEAIKEIVHVHPYSHTIRIGEVFLSYLWIVCYCSFSDFQEILENRYTNLGANEHQLQFNSEFIQYAASLFKKNYTWDLKKFPNPALFCCIDSDRINSATALFIHAIEFIIFHECAHVILEHGGKNKDIETGEQSIDIEYEADFLAWDLMLPNIYNKEEEVIDSMQIGAILGLSAIIFAREKLSDIDHPAEHKRVLEICRKMNIDELNRAWGFSALMLQRWSFTTNQMDSISLIQKEFSNHREYFNHIYNIIESK